jgi:hypothetical protein
MKLRYHNDADGILAAYLMSVTYHSPYRDCVSVRYGEVFPDTNEDTIFVDFTPPAEALQRMTGRVRIFDHHVHNYRVVQEATKHLHNISWVTSENHAACKIVHNFIRKKNPTDYELMQWWVDSINAWDTGWEMLPNLGAKVLVELVGVSGVPALCVEEAELVQRVELSRLTKELHRGLATSLSGIPLVLHNGAPFPKGLGKPQVLRVFFRVDEDGKWCYQLRGPGARELAQKHGGGGHNEAAGFTSTEWLFPVKPMKELQT